MRFSAVGALNTAVAYLTFTALVLWGRLAPSAAHAIGWIVGFLNSYALNRRFTFADRSLLASRAFSRFLASNLLVLGASTACVATFASPAAALAQRLGSTSDAGYAVLEAVVLVPALALNFLLADRWAFRPAAKDRAASPQPRTRC